MGTEALRGRILDSEERRWVRLQAVAPIKASKVGCIYRRFLPGLKGHISEASEETWARFIYENVTRGAPMPIGRIEDHVVNYIRRMRAASRDATPRETIGINKEIFMRTLVKARSIQRKGAEEQAA